MTTTQAPIHSGFGAQSMAREVIGSLRLDGRVAVVTGGYAGVGLETTRVLAMAGATVVVPAKSLDKARAALAGIRGVELESLNLADPASIDAFAKRFLEGGRPLHFLINNAGIMAAPFTRDARGYESQLATNHLGHFQLTAGLWPALKKARGARVVELSSRGHMRSAFDFEDPMFVSRPYDKWLAYGQSKTANALFALALDGRGQPHGVRAFSVHPVAIATDLMRFMGEDEQKKTLTIARNSAQGLKTVEQGAATSVWCATSPQLEGKGGVYCEDVDIANAVPGDFKELYGIRPWAMDPEAAQRLWEKSEQWTGAKVAG
jgi:NAD(P)-dependent dehydrogenase (short-subunit alcohol dehydrogenase family)